MRQTNGPAVSFSEALARLRHLLTTSGWPATITFIPCESVLAVPKHTAFILTPDAAGALPSGQDAYEIAQHEQVPAELHGVGYDERTSWAYVRVIHELGQGEAMFVQEGIKVTSALPPQRIVPVTSRLWWRVLTWAEARRMKRVLKALARAA